MISLQRCSYGIVARRRLSYGKYLLDNRCLYPRELCEKLRACWPGQGGRWEKRRSHSLKGCLQPIIEGWLVVDNVLILCWWRPQFLRISRMEKHPSSWAGMQAFRFGFLSSFFSSRILCLTMWMSFWKGDWGWGAAGLVGAPLTAYLPEQTDRCYSTCEWQWQQEGRVTGPPSPVGEEGGQYAALRAGLGGLERKAQSKHIPENQSIYPI